MSLFRRFLGKDPERSIEYLCQLVAEQNALQREVIRILSGKPSAVPVARAKPSEQRIYTDKDVFRVDRDAVIREEFRKKEAETAPWRVNGVPILNRGPVNLPTPGNGQDSARENPGNPNAPLPPISPDLF